MGTRSKTSAATQAESAVDQSDPAMICRTSGHNWRHTTVDEDHSNKIYKQNLWCRSCDSRKSEFITFDGRTPRPPSYNYSAEFIKSGKTK